MAAFTDYLSCVRASTGYAQTVAGVLVPFAANELRRTDKGLLIEEARTNIALQSQDFTTSWSTLQATVTSNAAVAPDGTTTADTLADTATNDRHILYQSAGGLVGVVTLSVYAKAGTASWFQLNMNDLGAGQHWACFNVTTGVIGNKTGGTTATIEALANGWFRCSISGTVNNAGGVYRQVFLTNNTDSAIIDMSYAGTGLTVHFWGVQLELGAYPSSYIPTTSAVTRAADAVQGIGTAETIIKGNDASVVASMDRMPRTAGQSTIVGGSAGYAPLYSQDETKVGLYLPAALAEKTGLASAVTNASKYGSTWSKAGGASATGQGLSVATSAGAAPANMGNVVIGSVGDANYVNNYIRRLSLWDERIADAALQERTVGPAVDLDFQNGIYSGATLLTDVLSCTRASTGYATTAEGTLIQFAANQLRRTSKGLLIEEARTNLALRSQEFATSPWNAENVSVTANAANAPDGTLTADLVIKSASATYHRISQTPAAATTTGTTTFYAKAGGYSWVGITDGVYAVNFNLASGVVGSVTGSVTTSIEALANGWYRCRVTHASSIGSQVMYLCPNAVDGGSDALDFVAGDGTSGVYLWGAQYEDAAYPSSYIPTTTAAVTRAADAVLITGAGDAIFTGVAGTAVISMDVIAAETQVTMLGSNPNPAIIFKLTSTQVGHYASPGGGLNRTGLASAITNAAKYGAAWNGSGRSVTGQGLSVATDAVGTAGGNIAGSSYLGAQAGTFFANAYIRRLSLWNTRLSDADLQEATA